MQNIEFDPGREGDVADSARVGFGDEQAGATEREGAVRRR